MSTADTLISFFNSIDGNTWALIVCFDLLLIATFCRRGGLSLLNKRNLDDWVLDLSGLIIQGTITPWLRAAIVIAGMAALLPDLAGTLEWHPVLAFLFCFVAIDYSYYWNHRIMHHRKLWPIHMVHHTAPQMDVLTTSRNTLWTSLFFVYLWLNGIMLFLLDNPSPYIMAITLTAILDLWRHSTLEPSGLTKKILGSLLILPSNHAWHHSQDIYDVNFGANLNLWDKLHGTWHESDLPPKQLGLQSNISLMSKLWWPFK